MKEVNMNFRLTNSQLALRYTILEIGFWGYACSSFGYETVFLEGRGMDPGIIGVIIAIGCSLGAVIQPILAGWADSGRYSLHRITAVMSILSLATFLGLCFTGSNNLANGVLFLLGTMEFFTLIPLTNSLSVYYNERGHELNYAVPRAIGSFSYAVTSYFLGRLVAGIGFVMIPAVTSGLNLLFLVMIFFMPMVEKKSAAVSCVGNASDDVSANAIKDAGADFRNGNDAGSAGSGEGNAAGQAFFLLRYKKFRVVLLGILMVYLFQNVTASYMVNIVENVGGGSAELGVGVAIAAICELPPMFLFAWMLTRVKNSTLIKVSAIAYMVKAILFLIITSVGQYYLCQILQLVTFGLLVPTTVRYAEDAVAPEDQFKSQAYMNLTNTLGCAVGSIIGGTLLEIAGVSLVFKAGLAFSVLGFIFIWIGDRME